jgi:hypothetical protein
VALLTSQVFRAMELSIPGLIPQSLQLQAQVTLASLGRCHKSGRCAKSCARRSLCFCSQSGGGAGIGLLTYQLLSRDCGRRVVRCVRLTLKVIMHTDEDFMDVILLYLMKLGLSFSRSNTLVYIV